MSVYDVDEDEPIDRKEAIETVLSMAQSIEGEWGGGNEHGAWREGKKILVALGIPEDEIPPLVRSIYGGWAVRGTALAVKDPEPAVLVPMNASQKAAAMRAGEHPNDAYGRPLTKNSKGEWVNVGGDTPCPNDGEMVNRRCWQCGWVRG